MHVLSQNIDFIFITLLSRYLLDVEVLRLIEKAELEGRVTTGVYPCAEALERLVYNVYLILRNDIYKI